MQVIDFIWNIKFLKGYRSHIARIFLIGVSAYQWIATVDVITKNIIDLPDIPLEVYAPLTLYFGAKIEQFAAEHNTV